MSPTSAVRGGHCDVTYEATASDEEREPACPRFVLMESAYQIELRMTLLRTCCIHRRNLLGHVGYRKEEQHVYVTYRSWSIVKVFHGT